MLWAGCGVDTVDATVVEGEGTLGDSRAVMGKRWGNGWGEAEAARVEAGAVGVDPDGVEVVGVVADSCFGRGGGGTGGSGSDTGMSARSRVLEDRLNDT